MPPMHVLSFALALAVAGGEERLQATRPAGGKLAAIVPAVQPDHIYRKDFVHDDQSSYPVRTTGQAAQPAQPAPASQEPFVWRKVAAEYVAMTLFVMIGCGSAMAIARDAGSAWVLQVALAFGFAITVLVYSLGRYSGGQINCAVTLGLWVSGQLYWEQAILNFIAQMLGSVTGATLLCFIFPEEKDKTGDLASNGIAEGFSDFRVLVAEFAMTFLLMITVLESGMQTGAASSIAVLPIGFAVFLAHCVLIPIDGCSINPTRSFGPALVANYRSDGKGQHFTDMWVFWVGPLLGALAAAGVHALLQL